MLFAALPAMAGTRSNRLELSCSIISKVSQFRDNARRGHTGSRAAILLYPGKQLRRKSTRHGYFAASHRRVSSGSGRNQNVSPIVIQLRSFSTVGMPSFQSARWNSWPAVVPFQSTSTPSRESTYMSGAIGPQKAQAVAPIISITSNQ